VRPAFPKSNSKPVKCKGSIMATRRTKRKVSKTKRAAKARAHGKSIYKVKGGWAVSRGKRRKARRRRR